VKAPEIETSRLRLRPFTTDDLEDLHLIFGDAEVMRHITGGKVRTRAETETGLRRTIEAWETRGFGFWAVTTKGQTAAIGYCGYLLLDRTPEIELAYGIARAHWGRGFATEAARACLRYGFEEMKLERIVAVVNPQNAHSQRVLEKLGMRHTGNAHHYDADLMYYELSSEDYEPDDAPYLLRRV
jgi:ribosomal-protein-alanine N-acetyltransferase